MTYEGCTYQCFFFDDFDEAHVGLYWQLLESEYGFKITKEE
jgi:hypothetical protein